MNGNINNEMTERKFKSLKQLAYIYKHVIENWLFTIILEHLYVIAH